MTKKTSKGWRAFQASVCVALLLLCGWRILRHYVPPGVKALAFTNYSQNRQTMTAPNGTVYDVRVNDAGAMHSGNHWTWVVEYRWLTGMHVVTEGYLEPQVALDSNPIPVTWDGNRPVLPFAKGRYE